MRGAVARLLIAAALFLFWIGYLAYLVVHTRDAVVLSRPQLLVSDLDVIAHVAAVDQLVTVEEVLYPNREWAAKLVGKKITVKNLADCRPPIHLRTKEDDRDFKGPGSYLLPLHEVPEGDKQDGLAQISEVAPTPPSPGFPHPGPPQLGPPRIYPATADVRAQYRMIPKP
jgi:hypothetical protein